MRPDVNFSEACLVGPGTRELQLKPTQRRARSDCWRAGPRTPVTRVEHESSCSATMAFRVARSQSALVLGAARVANSCAVDDALAGKQAQADQPDGFDEKTQIHVLERTQLQLPLRQGRAARHTHHYKPHGVLDLYAALNVATGEPAQPLPLHAYECLVAQPG